MRKLLRPLKRGDKIGLFSSSFPGSQRYPKRFKRACTLLNSEFKVIPGYLSNNNKIVNEYISGSRLQRAEEINLLIEECECLISTIGGYNSNSILELINYKKIESNRPIIIGYSDTCAVALAVYAVVGVPTFISQAAIPNFGEFPPFVLENYNLFMNSLVNIPREEVSIQAPSQWTDEWINWEDFERKKNFKKNNWSFINGGRARGKLIGGNLDTLCMLIGTKYMPKIDFDTILLIEESSIDISQIDRNLYTLKLHGVFNKIKGLIVSKFENVDYLNSKRNELTIIKEVLEDRRIPILANFDCGHTHPSMLLPIGGDVTIDCNEKEFLIDYMSVFKGGSY